ncbi:MAG: ubiquinol-cytochrome c reductase iron-sulfur subunit [Robiginitomaculum sp.]|nr:ubiquinol-cytochrome c reductase iron-sulfur subunit [Robiginitomaculum sp.]
MSDTDKFDTTNEEQVSKHGEPTRRDFIYIATAATAAVGAGAFAWPLVSQMSAAADTRAAGSIEIDLSKVSEGQQIKVLWRGKPVFVRYRTQKEIDEADAVDIETLRDPQTDDERFVPNPEGEINKNLLVMVGVCTHFGCIPVGEAGDFDGWYCPCHGSHYDTSGRIRKGPAPTNMVIPKYTYISDTVIKVG